MNLRTLITRLPGYRGLVNEQNRLRVELGQWRGEQSFPPGHFYSPVPHPAEVQASLDRRNGSDTEPQGVDLNWDGQLELFRSLQPHYEEFPFGTTESEKGSYRFYSDNGYFVGADAVALYAILRELRPKRIIEVGSGFSSALTLDVNDHWLDGSLECTFIDPNPERLLTNLNGSDTTRATILEQKVQDVGVALFADLEAGDILFIDSAHVTKSGGDVNFLMFDVLPCVAPGVWVHIHDIFYPFEYPPEWILGGRSWNEAYLVRAFLTHNSEFEIRLWVNALAARYPDVVPSIMPQSRVNTGASLWIQRRVR